MVELAPEHIAKRMSPRPRGRRPSALSVLPFVAPALAFYVLFVVYPMVSTIQISLYDWSGLATAPATYVGLDNYVSVLTKDPVFWTAFSNSLSWVLMSVLVPTTLGLVLALALNQALFGRNVFRAVFYLPGVLAAIAVAAIWRWMYNGDFGVLNSILNAVGLGGLAQAWLANPSIALFAVFAASTWQAVGANMILFLAGLQNVQKDLVEAARADGAGKVAVFRHVTLPTLMPTFLIVLVLTIINSLKVFDLVLGMTGGGPAQATQVLALWTYVQSFGTHHFGLGSAVATILLGITLLIIVPYLIWLLRGDEDA